MLKLKDGSLNPYVAGALLGLLAVLSAYLTTEYLSKTNFLGASTTFVRAAALLESLVAEEHVLNNEYFNKEKVSIDWQFMLVLGIFFGAFISSLMDKSYKLEGIPPLWNKQIGASKVKRAIFAFLGGIVAMIGARMADGCPSGHGLSGLMQLSLSGFVALLMFFSAGAVCANLFYRKKS